MKYQIINQNKKIIQEAKNIRELALKWNQLLIWADQIEIIDNGKKIDPKDIEEKFNSMIEEASPVKLKRSKLRGCQTIYK